MKQSFQIKSRRNTGRLLFMIRLVFSLFIWGVMINVTLAAPVLLKEAARDAYGVTCRMESGLLRLQLCSDRAVRVLYTPEKALPDLDSLVLQETRPVPFKFNEQEDAVTVSTDKMTVAVDRKSGRITFLDAEGNVLLQEPVGGGRTVRRSILHGEPTLAVEQTFVSPPDEYLFGSGQFQDGEFNLRGLPRRLTQVNSQIAVPFFLSSKGYALLWHNYGLVDLNPADNRIDLSPGEANGDAETVDVTTTEGTRQETRQQGVFGGNFIVDKAGSYAFLLDVGRSMANRWHIEIDGETLFDFRNLWLPPTTSWKMDLSAGTHTITVRGERNDKPSVFFRSEQDTTVLRSPVADALDYVFFAGTGDEAIGAYRDLTGAATLLPDWIFGYIHCRERFSSQQQLLENAREFRQRKLPMDVMVQDWQYWGKYGWNAMRFDEDQYPDPAEMVEELHAMNARLMLSVWSKIDPNSEVGRAFAEKGYYIPGTQWVDFFNPDAAAFYWKNFSEKLLSLGIDAWWQDATEPENDDLVGRKTHVGPGEKMRLVYPLFVTKTVYEGQRHGRPDQRVFILTRSAFLGQQRYAAATWSGDIGNSWETLRRQVPAGLNFVAAGLPYWTTDTGGFFRPGGGQYQDKGFHERFIRWFQYSTFCPLQRVHGYQTDTEFWRYGAEVEQEAKRYLDLRYRLFPYIYSEAARMTFEGTTLMRPLVMDFAGDETALTQSYEYMFGPAFLVSPVLEPGVKEWDVYLPQNEAGWIDFWTGKKLNGGQRVKAASPLDQIPLHVRAGSIVPLGPKQQYVGEKSSDTIELRVYTGADGHFALYEDEGDNYDYEKGNHAIIPIQWNEEQQTLVIGKRKGTFPGMLKTRTFHVVWVSSDHGVGIDPSEQPDAVVKYTGQAVQVPVK